MIFPFTQPCVIWLQHWQTAGSCASLMFLFCRTYPLMWVFFCYYMCDGNKNQTVGTVHTCPIYVVNNGLFSNVNTYCLRTEAHKTILENYVATVFKDMTIRIYRTPKQLGLIHARNVGVRLAQGPVVVVMDIHFEVQEHW